MKMADLIGHCSITEFQKILKSDNFSKNEIEDFLKANPDCSDIYIKEITMYVCEKYKNEINIYLEIAKCYLNRNTDESIKYLEIYKSNGGNNQDALILLMKLYRNIGKLNKALEIAGSINCDNNREAIEEVFGVLMLLDVNDKRFKQNLENIFKYVDNYKNKDKKNLFDRISNEMLKKIEIEKCEHLILTVTEKFKNFNLINKKSIAKRVLKCYLNLYIETAKVEFMDKAMGIVRCDKDDISSLFNTILKLKAKDLNIYHLLKIFKNNNDIFTDYNRFKIVETLLSTDTEDVIEKVNILCEFIDSDKCFDWKLSNTLVLILRGKKLGVDEKNNIIKLLKKYHKKNNNIKYKNILLNEIEILQNKIILKSKPRAIMASLTTRCNLKCIMCNVIDHNANQFYTMDTKFYNFVVTNMPYLEEVVWQGGEVFLYDKFKNLSDLAYKYNVRQSIITNGLLLNKDLINMINKYRINLQVSIDGPDKTTYEEIRVGAKFENLLKKIELLKKYRHEDYTTRYSMESVVISKNFKKLEDLVKFAILHKFESISFLKYIVYEKNDLKLSVEQMAEVSKKIIFLRKKYKNIFINTNIELNCNCEEKNKYDEQNTSVQNADDDSNNNNVQNHKVYEKLNHKIEKQQNNDLFCASPWRRIYLDFNKYIRITCVSNRMDIRKYKYNEIWNCSEMVEYRKKIVNNDLSNCNALCRGCGEYTERAKIGLF
ncbi:MAG: radical SAM protein [Endomicrobiaceae bacterium]|nr:radical SAM protein [Endomicrobiaceae bacterium]